MSSRRRFLPAVPVAVAIAAVAIGWSIGSARIDDTVGPGGWESAGSAEVVCLVGSGAELSIGQVRSGERTKIRHLDGAKIAGKWSRADRWRKGDVTAGPVVINQTGEGSGLVAHVAGKLPDDQGGGLTLMRCGESVDDGWFVGLDGQGQSQLELVNHGRETAVVDLLWWAESGPIEDPDSLGVRIARGKTETVNIEQIAPGEDLVGLQVVRRRQYLNVTAQMADVNGAEVLSPTSRPANSQVLTGIPTGTKTELLVLNSNDATAHIAVSAVGKEGRFAIEGLESVQVEPSRTARIELPAKANVAGGALLIDADQPVVATARASTQRDFAIVGASERLATPLALPTRLNGYQARVTLVALNKKSEVKVTAFDAKMKELTTKEFKLAADSRLVLNLAKEFKGAAAVAIETSGEVHAGVWLRDGDLVAATVAPGAPTRVFVPSIAVR